MAGFAEPQQPRWLCQHCGRPASWATSKGPACGSHLCAKLDRAIDLAESAWGVIANAGAGDWTRESTEWQEAAARWRDRYHDAIGTKRT